MYGVYVKIPNKNRESEKERMKKKTTTQNGKLKIEMKMKPTIYGYVCAQWTEPHMITSMKTRENESLFFCCLVLCILCLLLFDFNTAILVAHNALKHVKICKSQEYPRYETMQKKHTHTHTTRK